MLAIWHTSPNFIGRPKFNRPLASSRNDRQIRQRASGQKNLHLSHWRTCGVDHLSGSIMNFMINRLIQSRRVRTARSSRSYLFTNNFNERVGYKIILDLYAVYLHISLSFHKLPSLDRVQTHRARLLLRSFVRAAAI